MASSLKRGFNNSTPGVDVKYTLAPRQNAYTGRSGTNRPHCAAKKPGKSICEEHHMPLLIVKTIEGVFTPAQRQTMIRKLTETMVSIEGESLRPYTTVVVEEIRSGDWGVGGDSMTTEAVKSLMAGSRGK